MDSNGAAKEDFDTAERAIDVTLAGEQRILCMSTHGRGGLRRSLLGSVATEIIRSGDVPVLVVGPRCEPDQALHRPGPLLLCIDGSDRSDVAVTTGAEWCDVLDRDATMQLVVGPFDPVDPSTPEELFARLRPPFDDLPMEAGLGGRREGDDPGRPRRLRGQGEA